MNTFTTTTGKTVLADAEGHPITYSNRTQAERRVGQLRAAGISATAHQSILSRRFHVRIEAAR